MKQFKYIINGNVYNVSVNQVEDTTAEVEVNGTPYKVKMDKPAKKEFVTIKRPAQAPTTSTGAPVVNRHAAETSAAALKSPLPGVILTVDCTVGDTVKRGHKLFVLEAMKMEKPLLAPRAGTVESLAVRQGDTVSAGTRIAHISTEEAQ